MKGRLPTPEERALWRAVTRHDIKFQPEADDNFEAAIALPKPESSAKMNPIPTQHQRPTTRGLPRERVPGDVTALDGNAARRLKRGTLPIDWVVDLHGLTRAHAYETVADAIMEAVARRMRCIAIVTGKGRAGEGVLRQELPRWLNDGALRARVVAMVEAPPHMGGAGATLVYLRKEERVPL